MNGRVVNKYFPCVQAAISWNVLCPSTIKRASSNVSTRATQNLLGGRCVRRPFFDFVESRHNNDQRYSKVADSVIGFAYTRHITRSAFKFDNGINILPFIRKIVSRSIYSTSRTMALNKLSIDKVDLTDKRVLIRYIPFFTLLIHSSSK